MLMVNGATQAALKYKSMVCVNHAFFASDIGKVACACACLHIKRLLDVKGVNDVKMMSSQRSIG